MADSAISGLTVSTTPSGAAVGVIADVGVDYKISLINMAKAGGAVVLNSTQQTGSASITGSYTAGTSVYGATSALIVGTATFGTLSRGSLLDDGTNAILAAVSGGGVVLKANAGASSNSLTLDITNNVTLGAAGSYKTGSSIYGATSATVNGALAVVGAVTGVTTLTASGVVTASSFSGSGSGLSSHSIPNASIVTSPVTSVTASGYLTSSGGLTPNLTMTATPSFTSVTLGTALAVSSGGTGSATQNFVDITTTQTIGGSKTFSGTVVLSGASITAGTVNIGTGGAQTGVLPVANGGTAASSLGAAPFVVLTPGSQQTGSINISSTLTASSVLTGTSTYSTNAAVGGTLAVTGTTAVAALNASGSIASAGTVSMAYSFIRNKIINGAMAIDQRNNGTSITPTGPVYTVDRWKYLGTQASKFSAQQNNTSVSGPPGFPFDIGLISQSSYTVVTSDYFAISQAIEGANVSDLAFGTSNALPVTLSFWVRSSIVGTFGGSFQNSASTRVYPFSYTILNAATWTFITKTIPGDTAGTWVTSGNGIGLYLNFGLGSGSTYSGTAGAWATGNYIQPTSTVSVVGTSGANFFLTGVQLETGSTATPFEQRLYGTELSLCQRYCFLAGLQSYGGGGGGGNSIYGPAYAQSATNAFAVIYFPTPMRTLPTLTVLNLGTTNFQFNSTAANSLSAITVNLGTSLSVLLALTCTGLTPGAAGSLLSTAAGSGMIFSAEL
jgi:hypothetical protein